MRRFFAVIFAVVICLGMLTACSGKTYTAFELYERSVNAVNEAGGFEAKYDISVEAPDVDYSSVDSSKVEVNGDNWHLDWYESYIDWHIGMWVVDGMMYLTDDYDKAMFAAGEEETVPPISDYLPDLTPELLEGVDVLKTEDGYSFSMEPTDEILSTAFEGMLKEFVSDENVREVSEMTFTFNTEGIIESIEYSGRISGEILVGEKTTATVSAKCVFIDAGTAPEVTAPADAEEYILVE